MSRSYPHEAPAHPHGPSRRAALFAGALLPLALPSLLSSAQAAAPLQEEGRTLFNRVKLGQFEVTALLAGTGKITEPQKTFGLNASPESFAEASRAAFIPADSAVSFYVPTLINTGSALILFDTGLAPAAIMAALKAAGYTPDQVDTVVITHMHGDHIGGLMDGTTPTFPNARYLTSMIEYDYWSKAGNANVEAKVLPLKDKFTFLDDGDTVATGITAMLAAGHTPGHMVFLIQSEQQRLMLIADTANHYVWSVGHPDWEVRFDMDKAQAAATRHRILGMIAQERIPFIGYHMPFPGLGYLEARGEGFRYIAASYQLLP